VEKFTIALWLRLDGVREFTEYSGIGEKSDVPLLRPSSQNIQYLCGLVIWVSGLRRKAGYSVRDRLSGFGEFRLIDGIFLY
jgi:hypothetical protein